MYFPSAVSEITANSYIPFHLIARCRGPFHENPLV